MLESRAADKTQLLIDHSAWMRIGNPELPESRFNEFVDGFGAARVAVCMPFLFEASISQYRADRPVGSLGDPWSAPYVPVTEEAEHHALVARIQLTRLGWQDLSLVRVLIAALAHCGRMRVLHYDADFDVILENTALDFHSEWVMPRGSLS